MFSCNNTTTFTGNPKDEFNLLESMTEKLPENFFEKVLKYPNASSFQNLNKNRYPNVLAKEETRVCLNTSTCSTRRNCSDNDDGSDYINANFVISEDDSVYICAQAPLPSTFIDFWRMVWEQEASAIVMLTDLYSSEGELKAHCYWPTSQYLPLQLGDLKITLLQEEQENNIFIRTIKMMKLLEDGSETFKVINQIQYIGWPDFSIPSTTEFIRLLKLTDKHKDKTLKSDGDKRPIIVHCSAGIGRTGVFVAGRTCLKLAKKGKTYSLFDVVKSLREQRTGMVQTAQQYLFLSALLNKPLSTQRKNRNHFTSCLAETFVNIPIPSTELSA